MVDTPLVARLREELKGVDSLCAPSPQRVIGLSQLLKDLYDHSSDAAPGKRFGPLSSLTVDGMDLESLWEQLQTRNRPLLRFIKKKTSSLFQALKAKQQQQQQQQKQQQHTNSKAKNARVGRAHMREEEDEEEELEGEAEDEEDDEGEDEGAGLDVDDYEDDYEDDDREDVSDDEEQPRDGAEGPTDDDFLDDMNAWLDEGEEREELRERKILRREQLQAHKGADEYDDSDTEEDDEEYVQRELYSEKAADEPAFMYSDFFGSKSAPKRVTASRGKKGRRREEDDEEEEEDEEEENDLEEMDDEEEMDGEDVDEDGDDIEEGGVDTRNTVPQTSHQRHKAQLASQIKQLEAELIGPKSWELRGEVKGSDRPENSLLGVTADIERASKPAPIVTQEYTSSLEDLIRQRIDDERWDDVVPPPVREVVPQASNDLFLSQERSQTGLGDIYAQEFLSKTMSVNKSDEEAKREEHATVELKTLFHKICRQLDALSHFHYTPRPVVQEASISTAAVPSISLEDIIPSTVSGAQAIAPEEVHQKKRGREAALLSEAELTSDDRKRLRRASKSTRRKQLRSENQQNEAASRVGKASKKFEEKKLDAALRADSRVIDGAGAEGTGQKFSKSAAFFGSMQKQAQSNISDAKKASAAKKNQKSGGGGPTTSARVKL